METKHTPGEWGIERHDPELSRFFGNIQSKLGVGSNGIMNIRTIDIILKNCGEKEAEANAKLIVSAPSMLNTLQEIFDFTTGFPIGSNTYQIHMLCYNEIKKATE